MKNRVVLKKVFIIAVSLFTALSALCADDWTLAAQKFVLAQHDVSSSSLEGVSTLLPQLILDQIVTGGERIPSNREMLNRQLDTLLTERLSLFLQLSSEIKKRDSVFLVEQNEVLQKKKIEEEEIVITEIQELIDENLKKAEALKEKYRLPIEKEESGEINSDSKSKKKDFNLLTVFKRNDSTEEVEVPSSEKIVLYKNDSNTLFVPSETVIEAGFKSREFSKAISEQKINGLITGSITMYGDYIAVTAELFLYPGASSLGVITEVGTVADCVAIAENIALFLAPKIYTSMSVDVILAVEPEEALKNLKLTVDGVVYSSFQKQLRLRSGIHTIEFESKDYNSQTVTWNFKDVPSFLVEVKLTPKQNGKLNVYMARPYAGNFIINGLAPDNEIPGSYNTQATVNGQPVIGYFVTDNKLSSFFYIPEALSIPDQNLVVNLKPVDNAAEIDRRRIWMYRGYSVLICSLPLTFYSIGKCQSMENYIKQFDNMEKKISSDEAFYNFVNDYLKVWNPLRNISIGVSCAAGAFFIFELVRYLRAAEKVIPVTAKPMKSGENEILQALYDEYDSQKALEQKEAVTEEENTNTEKNEKTPAQETVSDQTENSEQLEVSENTIVEE